MLIVTAIGTFVVAPTAALAGGGPSAGDSQYVDPLSGGGPPASNVHPNSHRRSGAPGHTVSGTSGPSGIELVLAAGLVAVLIGTVVVLRRRGRHATAIR